MVDNIAFITWWLTAIPSRSNWLSASKRESFLKKGFHLLPRRGVLILLSRDWNQVSFKILARHDVPIHYQWTLPDRDNPRFARLDPVILASFAALNNDQLTSSEIAGWNDKFPSLALYNKNLIIRLRPKIDNPDFIPARFLLYWIVDEEGWMRRLVTNLMDILEYEAKYESRIVVKEGIIRARTFYRWRPLPLVDRIEVAQAEELAHYDISMGSPSVHEDQEERDPFDADEVRELHKGLCAPSRDRGNDRMPPPPPRTIIRKERPFPLETRSLQERITAPGRITVPIELADKRARESRSFSDHRPTPRGPKLDLRPHPYQSIRPAEKREAIATWATEIIGDRDYPIPDKRVVPVYSIESSSINNSVADNPSPQEQVLLNYVWAMDEPRDINETTFVRRLAVWGKQISEDRTILPLPEVNDWNKNLLVVGYLIADVAAVARMRYWAACYPEMRTLPEILNMAISRGVAFQIGVHSANLGFWCPEEISPLARLTSKQAHEAGVAEPGLQEGTGGTRLRDAYQIMLGNILSRPNAGAFIGRGGVSSWIARKYGDNEVIKKFQNGPSLIVAWHNKGDNDSKDPVPLRLQWEAVTPNELDALYGRVHTAKGDPDLWFFPPEEVLVSCSKRYSGEWNSAMDSVFEEIDEEINSNNPVPKTRGQWRVHIRKPDRPTTEPHPTKILPEFFKKGASRLEQSFGPSWNKKPLEDIKVPEQWN